MIGIWFYLIEAHIIKNRYLDECLVDSLSNPENIELGEDLITFLRDYQAQRL